MESYNLKFQSSFEKYFNSIVPQIAQKFGSEVANGITTNLGNGPTAAFNKQIPVHELKNNILPRIGNSPNDYLVKLECLATLILI